MRTYEVDAGERLDDAVAAMIALAKESGEAVTAEFNGINLTVDGKSVAGDVIAGYHAERERRYQEHINSPEYKLQQQEMEEESRRRELILQGALLVAPKQISLADPAAWEEFVQINKDPYSEAVLRYAEIWARLMEGRISHGDTVAGCAEEASHLADQEGITGFQYGCAVAILSKCWKHGEELRLWHNLRTQVSDEGKRANEKPGAVLNPAILRIG